MLVAIGPTHSYSFEEQSCLPSPNATIVGFSFDSNEFPASPYCDSGYSILGCVETFETFGRFEYIPNVHHTRRMRGNSKIESIQLFFSSFSTAPGDFLEISSPAQTDIFEGRRNSGNSFWWQRDFGDSLAADPLRVTWHSNEDLLVDSGFSITRLGYSCKESAPPTRPIIPLAEVGHREMGILTKSGDVLYYEIPGSPLFESYNLALWRETSDELTDFDLYVKCGSVPTITDYDAKATSADAEEFLEFNMREACGEDWDATTAYVAVFASRLGGVFNFIASPVVLNPTVRVGVEVSSSFDQNRDVVLERLTRIFQNVSREVFGFTEGQILITNWQIFTNRHECYDREVEDPVFSCRFNKCDVCITDTPWKQNRDGSDYTGFEVPDFEVVMLYSDYGEFAFNNVDWSSDSVAHEFAHYYMKFYDERRRGGKTSCAHSILGIPWAKINNICTNINHNRDRHPDVDADTRLRSVWEYSAPHFHLFFFDETPDNWDYREHDFNDVISVQIIE